MSLQAFRLKNFMAFEDTGWIELRPICLLFGKNSSGKSAIIRALRLLKQSLKYGSSEFPLMFYIEGGLDLHNYRVTVHQHDLQKVMGFHFKVDFSSPVFDQLLKVVDKYRRFNNEPPVTKSSSMTKELEIQLSYGFDVDDNKVKLVGVTIECPWKVLEDKGKRIAFSAERHMIVEKEKEENQLQGTWRWRRDWEFYSDFLHGHEIEKEAPIWSDAYFNLVSGFLPELISSVRVDEAKESTSKADFLIIRDLLEEFRDILSTFLKNMEWLGPIRPEPEREIYLERGKLRQWEDQGLKAYGDLLFKLFTEESLQTLRKWLRNLKLGYDILFESSGQKALGAVAEISIKEYKEGEAQNLIDMGFGTSQVLPILAAGLLYENIPLLIIEQPELHLHPSAQAELANIMVEIGKRGVPLFIETHSEHFLLRFRRWVAETTAQNTLEPENSLEEKLLVIDEKIFLQPKEIAIYFVYNEKSHGNLAPIFIDSKGELDLSNAPLEFDDFFAEDIKETIAIARARLISSRTKGDRNELDH